MYKYGDKDISINDALLILKTRLTEKDVAEDIWEAIQTCIRTLSNDKPFEIDNENDTITMSVQQYCDDCNEQFSNGVKVGSRALMKSKFVKSMYEKGVNDMATKIKELTPKSNPSTIDFYANQLIKENNKANI